LRTTFRAGGNRSGDETSPTSENRRASSAIWADFPHFFLEGIVQLCCCMLNGVSSSLETYLDLLSTRQKLIASNIANADTPGYKTRDLDFQAEFQNVLQGGQAHATEVAGLKTNNDGNNVSLDREARLLSEDALRFSAASQLLRRQMTTLKSAIDEGKNG
jgi:flagellar basal-body rod protein FlgB